MKIHRGFLPESLGPLPEKIAWLHIDLNAAKPEVETLEVLFERVVPSGIVILDDYGWLVLDAQKNAEDQFFAQRGYEVLELPTGQGMVVKRAAEPTRIIDLDRYATVFDGIVPFEGHVQPHFAVDFLGTLTDVKFGRDTRRHPGAAGGDTVKTELPSIEIGEDWFEAVTWVEAAKAARGTFTMMTLGAAYGAQAVGACLALKALNPMPYKLVAVDGDPENIEWTAEHFRNNGIDADNQWLVHAAVSDTNAPVLFPVGAPTSGSQNAVASNEKAARQAYFDEFVKAGTSTEALRMLLLQGTTGIKKNLVEGRDFIAEIKMVSAVTLADLLGPFEVVDLIEADMQQSEIVAFPPFMALLKRKVRRVHIGTHGRDVHDELARLFRRDGWEVLFDFAPNSQFETSLGRFATNDGILAAVNPSLTPGTVD